MGLLANGFIKLEVGNRRAIDILIPERGYAFNHTYVWRYGSMGYEWNPTFRLVAERLIVIHIRIRSPDN